MPRSYKTAARRPLSTAGMNKLLGLVGFAFVVSITPGPNNALLLASGIRFGFSRTVPHVAGTAAGMAALVLAMAAGIGVLLTEVPGAELALKAIGSAYLVYLAVRIATSQGSNRTVVSRPLGVLHAAAFQFANPKAWLFGLTAVGTFLPRHLAPIPGALVVARSEEHTSELQSHHDLVCRLLLEKKNQKQKTIQHTKKKQKHNIGQ